MDLQRPSTIHTDEALAPKGPWAFLGASLPGGFSAAGWTLIGGWIFLALVPAFFWANHLASYTEYAGGASALPAHWGEQLGAKDLVELFKNGEVYSPLGLMTGATLLVGLGLVLISGWQLQTRAVGLQAHARAWFLGLFDGLLLGVVPLGLVCGLSVFLLGLLSGHGLNGLSWTAFILKPLAWVSFVSALNVQWWILRLGREGAPQEFGTHLGHGFLRFWSHPVEWFLLIVGGSAVRLLLQVAAVWAGWRLGGSSAIRVMEVIGLSVLAAAINGWLLGWLLRVTALYWRHDLEVRRAVKALHAANQAPQLIPTEDLPLEVQG